MGVWIETSLGLIVIVDSMSHPAWVCGLKPIVYGTCKLLDVTPCVGVWIETIFVPQIDATNWSHPAWVCGLKREVA